MRSQPDAALPLSFRAGDSHTISIPKAFEKYIIGIWRFREAGTTGDWMATFVYKGQYYDARGLKDPQSAVDAVVNGILKLRRKSR